MTQGPRVVITKLQPSAPSAGVHRPRVAETLTRALDARLTLVCAPAGYGKTTALTSWWDRLQATDTRVAWLALEPADSDATHFWAQVLGALRLSGLALASGTDTVVGVTGTRVAMVVADVVNELAGQDEILLMLDDYHHIASALCHELMAELIAQAPPNLHLVLATRSDPPLALGRLRANGELAELRAADLRLSPDETGIVLREREGLELTADELAALTARTEGWPAAVHLAGLWLAGEEDVHRAIGAFAGDNRHVVDYLGEQVLAGLEPDLEEFLLRISVLGRFSAPLCTAVTQMDDAAGLIDRVERANLFITPLDGRREWYRLHRLFAGLLRARLLGRDADDVTPLHLRASAWHEEHGTPGEAIRHALAARDYPGAANLVSAMALPMAQIGRDATGLRWIMMFPEREVVRRQGLCLLGALNTSLAGGRPDEVRRWLDMARSAGPLPPGEALPSGVLSLEAGMLVTEGTFVLADVGAAVTCLRRAHDIERASGGLWRAPSVAALSFMLFVAGDRPGAAEAAATALADPEARARPHGSIHAHAVTALLALEAGEHDRCAREFARAFTFASACSLEGTISVALAHVARGLLTTRRGAPAEGRVDVQRGVDLLRDRASPVQNVFALVALVEACCADDDEACARDAIAEAAALLGTFSDAGTLPARLSEARRHLSMTRRRRMTDGDELSVAELSILGLLMTDATQRGIAEELFVSINTVKTHTRSIYRKLGVGSRADAVARATALELIRPHSPG